MEKSFLTRKTERAVLSQNQQRAEVCKYARPSRRFDSITMKLLLLHCSDYTLQEIKGRFISCSDVTGHSAEPVNASPSPADCGRAGRSDPERQSFLHLRRRAAKSSCVKLWSTSARFPCFTQKPCRPRGTTMSAACTVGSMYCSNAGLTNLLYCLMMPPMSRPRCEMSLFSLRMRRMSESVSTNTFMSSSWQTGSGAEGPGQLI